jgi:peptide deformylase
MPKLLNIVFHPNPILRKKSREIKKEELTGKNIQQLLLDMEETMIKNNGAGLAAPQIGLNIQAVVINNGDENLFLINPKITKKSWAKEIEEEGCLSIINEKGEIIFAPLARHKKVNCVYLDENGNKKTLAAEKILARAIQHEVDHLNGILFIDYLKNPPIKP